MHKKYAHPPAFFMQLEIFADGLSQAQHLLMRRQEDDSGTEKSHRHRGFLWGEHFSMERIDYIKRAAKRPE